MLLEYSFVFLMQALVLSYLIGGENGSTTMAPAHSAGILSPRKLSILAGVAILFGALLIGKNVTTTIGKKIVPPEVLVMDKFLLCYYLNSSVYIALAVYFKVPIATTHMVTLTIVSIGIYTGELNTQKVRHILRWWLFTPALSFLFGYIFEKFIYARMLRFLSDIERKGSKKLLNLFVVGSGVYFAFSAGANNLGNSMGVISIRFGSDDYDFVITSGAILFALGAFIASPKILRAVGEKIVKLGVVRASVLQVAEGTIIFVASVLGIPVSVNETITSGMIGVSCARDGFRNVFSRRYITTIFFFWFVIPWVALLTSFILCIVFDCLLD